MGGRPATSFVVPAAKTLEKSTAIKLHGAASSSSSGSSSNNNPTQAATLEGSSARVIRLRKQLQSIWEEQNDKCPVLLSGSRGSGKEELADEIVSNLPAWQTVEVHKLRLDEGMDYTDTILGTLNHPGLLDDLADRENATVVVNGFMSEHVESRDELDRRDELRRTYARLLSGKFLSVHSNTTKPFLPRVIGTTRQTKEYFNEILKEYDEAPRITFVKVPSFETRSADIKDIAQSKVFELESQFDLQNVTLSKTSVRRLLDHSWLGGEDELDEEMSKALTLLKREKRWIPFTSSVLESRHMFKNTSGEVRIRLLEVPFVRQILTSPWLFGKTLRYIVSPIFVLFLAVLFLGPQSREESAALTVFWAGWWPGIMLVFPFLGRIWCSVCPFMAWGDIAQELSVGLGVNLRKWPKWAEKHGNAFAFWLFFLILMWEELWELPQNANLSAWLLLLITSGAVVNSVVFEKRLWCRYMCPIGMMNSAFSTPSMTEVRTFQPNCIGCKNPTCFKGESPILDPDDKYAIKGCTMGLKNNQLTDMADCVMCMSCVKNCDRESPEFNLRPLGIDYGLPWFLPKFLQQNEELPISQVRTNFWLGGIVTILQGSVLLHYGPTILSNFGLDPTTMAAPPSFDSRFAAHATIAAALLGLPGTFSFLADAISVPLNSLEKVYERKYTRRPAENACIINFYETLVKQDLDMEGIIKELDADGDGTIGEWELKAAMDDLSIPSFQQSMIIDLLLDNNQHRVNVETFMDNLQELYFDINEFKQSEVTPSLRSIADENELQTTLTFREIFDKLDKDDSGYVEKSEFQGLNKFLKSPLTEDDLAKMFSQADSLGLGRLNALEFASVLRKTVKVGIQEIGYGYIPLAWGSLTAYWIGLGMSELGLLIERIPSTFYLPVSESFRSSLPQITASTSVIHFSQTVVMCVSALASMSLTQKLCDDNRVGTTRYATHAFVQIAGAFITLQLMLSPTGVVSAYR